MLALVVLNVRVFANLPNTACRAEAGLSKGREEEKSWTRSAAAAARRGTVNRWSGLGASTEGLMLQYLWIIQCNLDPGMILSGRFRK